MVGIPQSLKSCQRNKLAFCSRTKIWRCLERQECLDDTGRQSHGSRSGHTWRCSRRLCISSCLWSFAILSKSNWALCEKMCPDALQRSVTCVLLPQMPWNSWQNISPPAALPCTAAPYFWNSRVILGISKDFFNWCAHTHTTPQRAEEQWPTVKRTWTLL